MNYKGKFGGRVTGSALLAALRVNGCASAHTANPQATLARDQAQIQQRLQEVIAAAESKDFNRLDGYHLYGPKFTKFSGSSPERLDAAAGRKGEHDGLGAAKGLKMRADALKTQRYVISYRAGRRLDRRFPAWPTDRAGRRFAREGRRGPPPRQCQLRGGERLPTGRGPA